MIQSHEDGLAAVFDLDLQNTSDVSSSERTHSAWVLPPHLASWLQSLPGQQDLSLLFASALRILHFRHSGLEKASVAVLDSADPSLIRPFSIYVEHTTSIERVFETAKALNAALEPSATAEFAKSITPGQLCVRYSETDTEDSTFNQYV
jgi:hypothetical protein